jgi:hypothetical protein
LNRAFNVSRVRPSGSSTGFTVESVTILALIGVESPFKDGIGFRFLSGVSGVGSWPVSFALPLTSGGSGVRRDSPLEGSAMTDEVCLSGAGGSEDASSAEASTFPDAGGFGSFFGLMLMFVPWCDERTQRRRP